jgi:hypothetical protein
MKTNVLAAWAVFVTAMVLTFPNRARIGDVALIIIAICAGCYLAARGISHTASRVRKARGRRRAVSTGWTHYSRPVSGRPGMWEIGIERRTSEGQLLDPQQPAMKTLPEDSSFDITLAEEEAKVKATRYNDNRVGMPPS